MSSISTWTKGHRKLVIGSILILLLLITALVTRQITVNNPKSHTNGITDIAWNPVHNGFVSVSDQDGIILIRSWNGEEYEISASLTDSRFTSGGIQDVEWHPSGQYFVITDLFDGIFFYSDRGELLQSYEYEQTDRLGENGAVYTIEWSPDGDHLAVMEQRGEDADLEIHIYDTGDVSATEEEELVDFSSFQIIEDIHTLGSMHNHILWISQNTIVVGTSGSSNSNRGNITTYHLRNSGPILELNQSIGSVYQLEYYPEQGFGMVMYSKLADGYDLSEIHKSEVFHEVVVFNSTLDIVSKMNQSYFRGIYLDPVHGDLVQFTNVSSEPVGQHLEPTSLEVTSSYPITEDLYHGGVYFSTIEPYFVKVSGNKVIIHNSTNFELFTTHQ